MKCIKAIKTSKKAEVGTILRVDDIEAEARVKSTYWVYINKAEWKAAQPKKEVAKSSQEIVDETSIAISVTRSNETVSAKILKNRRKQK